MKIYLSLLSIQMRGVMWVAWMFIFIGLLWNGLPLLIGKGPNSGLFTVLTLFPCFYTVMVAYYLVIKDRTKALSGFRIMPHAEFITSRPVSRKLGYAVFLTIFFSLVIGPSLVNVAYASQHPVLEFLCYKSGSHQTEAAAHRDEYLRIMPGSHIEERPKSSPVIVWPQGALFVAAWKLLVVLVLAVMVQFVVFLNISNLGKKIAAVLVMGIPFLLMFLTIKPESVWYSAYQSAFGIFTVHWGMVAISVGLLFILAQTWAFRLAANVDVD